MKKIVLLTLALFLFAGSAVAAELKIGFFNMNDVALECDAYKDAQKRIQGAHTAEQQAIEKQGQELQKKVDAFNAQASALSVEAREERNLELMRLSRDFDDRKNAFIRKVSAAENRARDEIARAIVLASIDYGKRNRYSVIQDSNTAGAMYVDASIDITADILKETNRIWKEKPKALTDDRPIEEAGARLR